MKVLLVSMPFGALDRPALGLSLLKAQLAKAGFAFDVRYLNFSFAELVGCEDLSLDGPACLTWPLPGTGPSRRRSTVHGRPMRAISTRSCGAPGSSTPTISRASCRSRAGPHFLDYCMETVAWKEYAVVGFTSTFEQNIASLALARRIKARHRGIDIVFGGANWESEMGLALHSTFEFVDYVCSGEADASFPALLRHLRSRRRRGGALPFPASYIASTAVRRSPVRRRSSAIWTRVQFLISPIISPPLNAAVHRAWRRPSSCARPRAAAGGGRSPIAPSAASTAAPWRSGARARPAPSRDRRSSPRDGVAPFIQFVDNILDMKYFDTVLKELADRQLRRASSTKSRRT